MLIAGLIVAGIVVRRSDAAPKGRLSAPVTACAVPQRRALTDLAAVLADGIQ
ncbi:hypothetical protein GCM10023196_050120 [Actinoallomurus vinaceus]|uniref:Uncharacterized protein n=1 Tax=Actinoallomurus vinaceus TaxID=1080074 RepID=A0ABP8UGM2_9ACTN